SGGNAQGGGLLVLNGTVNLDDSTRFVNNEVEAGAGAAGGGGGGLGGTDYVVGGNLIQGSAAASTTPTNPPPPTPAPVTVLGVKWQTHKLGRRKSEKVLVVTYSGALNPASAENLRAYQLLPARHNQRFARKDRLTSATYDASAVAVMLTTRGG